jgi:predicted N-acetyltransferase YhbS
VWVESGSQTVVGYFTLAAHLLRRVDVPKGIGRGSPEVIPTILLARLALDHTLQGQGIGGQLLFDALERTISDTVVPMDVAI